MVRGKIGEMLRSQKKHISFHTPGHKRGGADITELSYSDNLYSPHGVIREAEREVAGLLGAARTFFLTDGSTSGVHAMLYALKTKGVKRIALSPFSHPSVLGGIKLMGLTPVYFPARVKEGIPQQPNKEETERGIGEADALLLTSPDYYGFFPALSFARALCDEAKKPLCIDGAHGSHLHGTPLHAGNFADLWVDGAHKSLPALTQGAAVSAKGEEWCAPLEEGVRLFRTSSPSYPILASVEEAFLYPRNKGLEKAIALMKARVHAVENADWTKILIPFGSECGAAQRFLEERGIYPEFNDGNYLMFYASPCTKRAELKRLEECISLLPRGEIVSPSLQEGERGEEEELVPLAEAAGRVCARDCGIFPPSLAILRTGDIIDKEALSRLKDATHTFGLTEGKISVYKKQP